MRKYNIIIIEDEPYAARYIKTIAESIQNLTVSALYESAEEALELEDFSNIDIVITDIKMAGMTGIELLKEINKTKPGIKSVIISGYSDFSYAKEAIHIGVSNYILKPINEEELTEILIKIYRELEKKDSDELEKILNIVYQNSETILNNADQYEWDFSGILMVAGSVKQETLIRFCYNLTRKWEGKRYIFLLYRYTLLILEKDLSKSRSDLKKIANMIQNNREYNGNSMLCLIGEFPIDFQNIKDLNNELAKMYKYHQQNLIPGKTQILYYSMDFYTNIEISRSEKAITDKLMQNINTQNFDGFQNYYKKLFDLFEERQSSIYSIKQSIYGIVIHLFYIDAEKTDPVIEINKILRTLYSCKSYEEARERVWNILSPLLLRFQTEKINMQSHSLQIYGKITDYVNMNISNNYSLQEISDMFGISQPYVSKLFRKYYNGSYKEYVINRKMTIAIQLMKENPDIQIKEIAEKVGYEQAYFSSSFYKIMGEYPKQYRSHLISEGNEKIEEI